MLARVGRLVKAVFPQFGGFQVVLVGQPADGLGTHPQLLSKIGGAPELAGYPGGFDRQIEVSQDAADLGKLGRLGKSGGEYGIYQIVQQLAALVDEL
ncbi:hypothetical protein HR52_04325 [Aeromonas hydrophila]|nr:hypothetical protein HR52_04325 [Aeromonas hydrophila]OCA67393.1 hypothetical protein A9R12_01745 [Aeromonas hydrophila]